MSRVSVGSEGGKKSPSPEPLPLGQGCKAQDSREIVCVALLPCQPIKPVSPVHPLCPHKSHTLYTSWFRVLGFGSVTEGLALSLARHM